MENCVLFRGVHIGKGTKISNCVVLQACDIQEDCELSYVILDKAAPSARDAALRATTASP